MAIRTLLRKVHVCCREKSLVRRRVEFHLSRLPCSVLVNNAYLLCLAGRQTG